MRVHSRIFFFNIYIYIYDVYKQVNLRMEFLFIRLRISSNQDDTVCCMREEQKERKKSMYKIHGLLCFYVHIYADRYETENETKKTNGYCSKYKKENKQVFFLNLLYGIEITTSKYTHDSQ